MHKLVHLKTSMKSTGTTTAHSNRECDKFGAIRATYLASPIVNPFLVQWSQFRRPSARFGEDEEPDRETSEELVQLANVMTLRPNPTGPKGRSLTADQIAGRIIPPAINESHDFHGFDHFGTKKLSMGEFVALCDLGQFLTALEVEFSDENGGTAIVQR
ncbi:hypothetical protein BKA59DRAFT_456665 [Fusarium tricinctum]|uniref:Uncharacterized protein n=1 Tax=Fusarium tricinctum TaxID=61284 RepID=A0A8K0RUL0_9HYPO|nr:hypothetical protein BKA59DRAFT_456665 [Fusarium tricinctum]